VLLAMLASQGLGFVATLLILIVSAEPMAASDSLIWAAIAGTSGVTGLALFYLALARGTMGLVAPLAALIGAGLPVLLAIVEGEQPDPFRLAGIAIALVAVVLISFPTGGGSDAEQRPTRMDITELPVVILSGLGFAGFFVAIDKAAESGAMWWPLVVVRVFGVALVLLGIIFIAWRRHSGTVRARTSDALGLDGLRSSGRTLVAWLPIFLICGAGDLGGNAFFILARGADDLSVAVVLSSLYPIVTTLLATIFLRERLGPLQILGVVLATLSVPLLR
jgi:drug/metabolite transporter (DMT)-like permease